MTYWENVKNIFLAYYDELALLLPQIVFGMVALFLFWVLSKYVHRILRRALESKFDDPLVLKFVLQISRLILLGVATLVFLKIIGLGDIAFGLWGTAGIGAFVLGFAFKDIGEHFLAGIILAFNRPFNTGDVILVNDHLGKVLGLDLRNTHIKTFDGKDVYIPNGIVVKNSLTNYTIDGFIRNKITIGIDAKSDLSLASEILVDVMKAHPYILEGDRNPSLQINRVEDGALYFDALYWLDLTSEGINSNRVGVELAENFITTLKKQGFNSPAKLVEIVK